MALNPVRFAQIARPLVSAAERQAVADIPGKVEEAACIAADLAYSRMKADGTLQALADRRALVDQVKAGVL